MKQYIFFDTYNRHPVTLRRISKNRARIAYNNGLDVLFIPVKCDPVNPFYRLGIWENKHLEGQYDNFDKLVNAFEYYNCNAETGRYTAFYIPTIYSDRFSGQPTDNNPNAILSYNYNYKGV